MMLLEVEAVDLHLPGRPGPVLEGVSLGVGAGEILALIGESGSGKSLIARAASGFLPEGARIGGALRVCGVPIGAAGPAGGWGALRGRAVAHLFQDARRHLHPALTVGRQIAQVAARHGTRPEMPEAAIARALPGALSAGGCQIAALALALATPARLILADEPTAHLDPPAAGAVLARLRARAAAGAGVILITHDLALGLGAADRVAVIHAGQIVETAPAAGWRPRHPYAAALMAAMPALAPDLGALRPVAGRMPVPGDAGLPACRFAPRCPRAGAVCVTTRPALRALGPGAMVACHDPEVGR